jgi:hypothetical protein
MKDDIPSDVMVTYQLQHRKCMKCNKCKDKNFPGHGPYWYAYYHEDGTEPRQRGRGFKKGRLRNVYVGRNHPDLAELTDAITHDEERVV